MSSQSVSSGVDMFTPSDFELIYPISEHNAGRSCSTCQEGAWVYLFSDGFISTFRCRKHTPPAVRDHLDTEGDS